MSARRESGDKPNPGKEQGKPKQMKSITENVEFKAVSDPLTAIQTELTEKEREAEEIYIELSRPRQTDGEDAFATYLTKEEAFAIDQRSELREKLRANEHRQAFLRSALKQGQAELDKVIGQLSLAACKETRPRCVKALEKQLNGLKQTHDANRELLDIRDELQRAGYQTGSLPFCQFNAVEVWESPYGSNVQAHRKYIRENYSEVKEPK